MALLDTRTDALPVDLPARPRLSLPGARGGSAMPVAVGPGMPDPFRLGPMDPLGFGVEMKFPLQLAKVQRPALREQTLHRERLLQWLDDEIHRRVVLVVAKAGYGKTTLLSDFALRTRVRTLWLCLDEEDGDWVSFLHYLVAAGRQVDPAFAPETGRMLDATDSGTTRQEMLQTFYREMQTLGSVPSALIFDDYHLVDRIQDIRSIVHDLVAHAPPQLTLVFLARRRPALPIARLRTLGEVAELDGDDLLFHRAETERLFRETYRRPLEPDVLSALQDRTEGWAASLEMVHAALRNRTPTDVRRFVHGLTGEQEVLYGYLAEEVGASLDDEMQQFLMKTSLLQVVSPNVAEIVADTTLARATALIESAEELGLLTPRTDAATHSQRYHPLVRDFLSARLRRQIGVDGVAALHRRIARYAEGPGTNWRLATHHYAAAGDVTDLHRVLAKATGTILATGEFALAQSYVDRFPPAVPNPWFELFMSRADLKDGRVEAARARTIAALDGFGGFDAPSDHAGVNLAITNLIAVEMAAGRVDNCERLARTLRERSQDISLVAIGESTIAVVRSTSDGNLVEARDTLRAAARLQRTTGHGHYLGITLLNLALIDRARGCPEAALQEASEAIQLLSETSAGPELASARIAKAWALAHLYRWDEAAEILQEALLDPHPLVRPEVFVEAAVIYGYYGDPVKADELLASTHPDPQTAIYGSWLMARAESCMRHRLLDDASQCLEAASTSALAQEPAAQTHLLTLLGQLAVARHDPEAPRFLNAAASAARSQESGFWEACLELQRATLLTPHDFSLAVKSLGREGAAFLTICAEAIAPRLKDLDGEARRLVALEVSKRPQRWRTPLRDALAVGDPESRLGSARLLEQVGSLEDVPRLRALGRQLKGRNRDVMLGRRLARQLANRVFVEDQGPVSIRVGDRVVAGTQIRRKVLSLLCYLLTRPEFTATRDQALEALWPDLTPADAINSLNQTVYFLRRVFEQDFLEDSSAGYVETDADLVKLDSELIDSRSCRSGSLMRAMGRRLEPAQVDELSLLYRSRFALDFAYEEWASAYRDSMHATYLEIMERSIAEDMRSGHNDRAIGIARRTLDADPEADHIELSLLRLYRRIGAHAAAAEQYGHYAALLRNDLGVEPPPLESL